MELTISLSTNINLNKQIEMDELQLEDLLQEIISIIFSDKEVIALSPNQEIFEDSFEEIEIDFYICDNTEIQKLNLEYRDIDSPTDVLSFAMLENVESLEMPILHLGEIIISADKIIEQAKEHEHSILHELTVLASHGILHLIGIHHETDDDYHEILAIQQKVVEAILNKYE
jgi:probable rRNA maturation factor